MRPVTVGWDRIDMDLTQVATCQWNMWEYRHSPIHACHGPVGEDKTPEHLEFMNHVVGAYKLTHVTTSNTEPCTYQSRSQTSFFEPAGVVWWPGRSRCCCFCSSRYSACALLPKVKVSVTLSNWQVEWKSRVVVYVVSRSRPNSHTKSAELWFCIKGRQIRVNYVARLPGRVWLRETRSEGQPIDSQFTSVSRSNLAELYPAWLNKYSGADPKKMKGEVAKVVCSEIFG